MEYYIYYNNGSYLACNHEESIGHVSGLGVIVCSSIFWKESFKNLNNYVQGSGTSIITPNVFEEILEKKNNPAYSPYFNSDKLYLLKSLEKFSVGTDLDSVPKIGHICDVEPSLVENGELIILCADLHEAANSLYRGKPYLYRIDKCDLAKYNGLKNYRLAHIKQVDIRAKQINNKK